jgi:hypothetical protein
MLKVKKINMVAMVTEIAIYLHFTRKTQYIGFEKAIFHEFFYYIYHLNMINSNLQHKYVYLKQISDIFIKQ